MLCTCANNENYVIDLEFNSMNSGSVKSRIMEIDHYVVIEKNKADRSSISYELDWNIGAP
jgi:hypothetical protein